MRLFDWAIQEINHKYNWEYGEQVETLVTSSLTNLTSNVTTVLWDKPNDLNTYQWIKNSISEWVTSSNNRQEWIRHAISTLIQTTEMSKSNGNNRNSRQMWYMLYPTQAR